MIIYYETFKENFKNLTNNIKAEIEPFFTSKELDELITETDFVKQY